MRVIRFSHIFTLMALGLPGGCAGTTGQPITAASGITQAVAPVRLSYAVGRSVVALGEVIGATVPPVLTQGLTSASVQKVWGSATGIAVAPLVTPGAALVLTIRAVKRAV